MSTTLTRSRKVRVNPGDLVIDLKPARVLAVHLETRSTRDFEKLNGNQVGAKPTPQTGLGVISHRRIESDRIYTGQAFR